MFGHRRRLPIPLLLRGISVENTSMTTKKNFMVHLLFLLYSQLAQRPSASASIRINTAVALRAFFTRLIEFGSCRMLTSALLRFSVARAWHAWHSGPVSCES